jgi:hypothetical protein
MLDLKSKHGKSNIIHLSTKNIMTRLLLTTALFIGLQGCGQREQQSTVVVVSSVATDDSNTVQKITTADPQSGQNGTAPAVATAQPPTTFEYPADLTGKAVVKAVAPETPALTPNERFGTAQKSRIAPTRILNPDAMAKADSALPHILSFKPNAVSIAPPPEKVPFDLGRGADTIPAKPSFPIAAVITEKARDVNLPPSMPTLGRPFNERVSVDDPTSELANAAIVAPDVNVPLKSAEFVKVGLPDPFELGEQVKPKVLPAAEPGLNPVPVNPQRVK